MNSLHMVYLATFILAIVSSDNNFYSLVNSSDEVKSTDEGIS